MGITKKQFIELMEEYGKILEAEDKISGAMKLLDEDFNYFSIRNATFLFEKAISLALDDRWDWIQYFIYDCDWWRNPLTVEIDNKKFKLTTLSKLYDIITKQ